MRQVDLAIVGAGVAGLSAATVAAQHGLSVLVIERMGAGGQVMNVETIHNMPGFPNGISGFELGPLLQEQAEAAGAQFMLDTVATVRAAPVLRQAQDDGESGPSASSGQAAFVVECEGESVQARAVLVAAGSIRRKLGVPGEELEGRGVSHCASCDGPMFRGQPVCVVGGGDSAFGEAAVLAGQASRVTLVFSGRRPHAQKLLVDAIAGLPQVQLVADSEVTAITAQDGVTGLRIRQDDGTVRELPARGVFVYAGLQPASAFLADTLRLDAAGRILTDAHFGSSVPGIFAAGDIRAGAAWLLASAAGEGAAAAVAACRYLQEDSGS
ncbi:NAD(P)/FAD-dependent oxidoreductase [Caenimonas terrae]|uniref:NAD(P)/FAD-dependent oxidoreductase n=1 Tax=Caenimonas terrae TaxID=696074 RepID=A0ABW0N978_9BURK